MLTAYPLIEIDRQANLGFRLLAIALTLIIGAVLLLSAAGIYALMSFTCRSGGRKSGFGSRLAPVRVGCWLASSRARAVQLGLGVVFGLAIALGADMLSGGTLFRKDGAVLLPAIAVVMACVGLLAALGPARRACGRNTQALCDEYIAYTSGPITMSTRPGPWMPSVSVNSMSAVRLGPVMNVHDAPPSTSDSRAAKNSPIVA